MLSNLRVVAQYSCLALYHISKYEHSLSELGVVDAIIDLLEAIAHLQALSVQLHHVLIVLQGYYVECKLAIEFLPFILSVVLSSNIALYVLEQSVYLQVLHKATVIELIEEVIFSGKLAHTAFASQDARNVFEMYHKRRIEFGLLLLGLIQLLDLQQLLELHSSVLIQTKQSPQDFANLPVWD